MQSKQTASSTNLSPTNQPVSQSPTRRLLAMLPHGLESWPHRTAWSTGAASPRVCFARNYHLWQSDHGARVDGDLSASPASPPGSSFPDVWGLWYSRTPTLFRYLSLVNTSSIVTAPCHQIGQGRGVRGIPFAMWHPTPSPEYCDIGHASG
ncbi:hypothetical protein BC567DRAFT_80301 [Phyllosticta citribraziliensis]